MTVPVAYRPRHDWEVVRNSRPWMTAAQLGARQLIVRAVAVPTRNYIGRHRGPCTCDAPVSRDDRAGFRVWTPGATS
jgi:hypothetical protein